MASLHRKLEASTYRDEVVEKSNRVKQVRLPGRVRTDEKDATLQCDVKLGEIAPVGQPEMRNAQGSAHFQSARPNGTYAPPKLHRHTERIGAIRMAGVLSALITTGRWAEKVTRGRSRTAG